MKRRPRRPTPGQPGEPRPGSGPDAGPPADPESVARSICLRLLATQPRTRSELATALAKREVPAEAAEAVLVRFDEVGLIDDAAFAAAWVDTRHRGRGLARQALARELRQRGVAQDTARTALDRLDPDDEIRTARALVARRRTATRRLAPEVEVRRLVGMLGRKGYPPGLALRVVREALAENAEASAVLDEVDETTL
ncbi:MAG TPA: regulatory protein RecX [Cryptosporangiaceae bacterium]|nr:regulatory protein RecX [Cryptosporangiaceae bacterium]